MKSKGGASHVARIRGHRLQPRPDLEILARVLGVIASQRRAKLLVDVSTSSVQKQQKTKTTTYLDQNEWNRDESNRNESERRTSPVNAQISVHGVGEEREASAESRAHEIVSSKDRSRVLGVGIGQVVENAVEEQESSDGEP